MNRSLTALAAALLLAGCVSSSDLERIESRIEDLNDQIADLKRQSSSREEVQKLNDTIVKQTDSLMKSSADVTVRVADLDDKLQNTQGSIEQTNYRIDRIVQQLTQAQRDITELKNATRGSAPGTEEGRPIQDEVTVDAPAAVEDPLEIYQAAYRDYQKGSYDLALQGFRDFVKANPSSDLSDNASYWIGESLFSQKKYREAIQQFDTVINTYKRSDKIPAALLKKGYAHIELSEKAQGVVQLQYVIHEHPRSQEAALARQKLKTLGIETR